MVAGDVPLAAVPSSPKKPKRRKRPAWFPFGRRESSDEEETTQEPQQPSDTASRTPSKAQEQTTVSAVPADTSSPSAPGSSLADMSVQQPVESTTVFSWFEGGALPAGSKMLDGSPVPEGAQFQADGSVLLPDGTRISADTVTLSDGVQLSAVLDVSAQATSSSATASDASAPVQSTAADGTSVFTWEWIVGSTLPQGTLFVDGSLVPEGALPQADGTILLPDGSNVSVDQVSLPDGGKLSLVMGSLVVETPTGSVSQTQPEGKGQMQWPRSKEPSSTGDTPTAGAKPTCCSVMIVYKILLTCHC